MSEHTPGTWLIRIGPLPPDRSTYRHPPYWYPDTLLPLFEETADE